MESQDLIEHTELRIACVHSQRAMHQTMKVALALDEHFPRAWEYGRNELLLRSIQTRWERDPDLALVQAKLHVPQIHVREHRAIFASCATVAGTFGRDGDPEQVGERE